MDIKAPKGTPVHAAAAGVVVFSGRQSSYGRVVKIRHANGLSTTYAHNSANFVKVGERVKAGALIGAVGRTTVIEPSPTLRRMTRRLGRCG